MIITKLIPKIKIKKKKPKKKKNTCPTLKQHSTIDNKRTKN